MAFFKFKGTDQRLEADGPDGLAAALHETLNIAQAAFEAETAGDNERFFGSNLGLAGGPGARYRAECY